MSDKKYEDFGKRIAEKFTDFGKKKDKDIHISFSFGGNTKNIDIDTDDFEGISFFCGGSKGKTEADGNKQKQGENSEKTWNYKKDPDDGAEKIRREAEEIRREAEKIRREAEKADLNREAEKIRREAEEIRRKVEREYNKRERAGSEEDPKGDHFSGKNFYGTCYGAGRNKGVFVFETDDKHGDGKHSSHYDSEMRNEGASSYRDSRDEDFDSFRDEFDWEEKQGSFFGGKGGFHSEDTEGFGFFADDIGNETGKKSGKKQKEVFESEEFRKKMVDLSEKINEISKDISKAVKRAVDEAIKANFPSEQKVNEMKRMFGSYYDSDQYGWFSVKNKVDRLFNPKLR